MSNLGSGRVPVAGFLFAFQTRDFLWWGGDCHT